MGWSNIFIHRTEKYHNLSRKEKENIATSFDQFYSAIKNKHMIEIKYKVEDKEYERRCIPFDYGIFRRRPYRICFHGRTVGIKEGDYTLHIEPENISEIKESDKSFAPSDYVDWEPPYRWHIPRDWGEYS